MRSLLLGALSLVAALTDTRDADACGGYRPGPEVFQLTAHTVIDRDRPGRAPSTRVFALLPWDHAPADGLAWRRISPMSFDATEIASATPFANPVTLTLLGPSGARVVSTTKHVFLSRSWHFDRPVGAVEVTAQGDFQIALRGNLAGARWVELDDVATTKPLEAWVQANAGSAGRDGVESIFASRVRGTTTEVVSFYSRSQQRRVTLLKVGTASYGALAGTPLGAFSLDGRIQLAVGDRVAVRTIPL